jgi:hypothetical protein
MITVVLSGEYFPYYNMKLSKITKEHIYEQGLSCCVVLLANKSKNNEIYKTLPHHYDVRRYDSSPIRERENSFFTTARMTNSEIKHIIHRNYEILSGIDEPSIRKKSIDSLVKITDDIASYKNEFNSFSHVIPKWLKTFFINPENIGSAKGFLGNNILRKMSVGTPIADLLSTAQENIVDNEILNTRFLEKPSDEEYNSLRHTFNARTSDETQVDINTEDDIKELLNIYRTEYLDKKSKDTNKQKDKNVAGGGADNNVMAEDGQMLENKSDNKDITKNSDETMEENKEFYKKIADYEYEIFSRKNQRNYTLKSPKVRFSLTRLAKRTRAKNFKNKRTKYS